MLARLFSYILKTGIPLVRAEVFQESLFKDFVKNRSPDDLKFRFHPNAGNEKLVYTTISSQTVSNGYKRLLLNSRIFKYTAKNDFTGHVNLFSATEFYHPVLIVSEKTGEDEFEVVCTQCNQSIFFYKDSTYIFEVGVLHEYDSFPFEHKEEGLFVLLISSKIFSVFDYLINEQIRIGINGFTGKVDFKRDSNLVLHNYIKDHESFGRLDPTITPFYHSTNRSITFYYNNGSTEFTHGKPKATSIEVACTKKQKKNYVHYGKEEEEALYYFVVYCKGICKVINEIS